MWWTGGAGMAEKEEEEVRGWREREGKEERAGSKGKIWDIFFFLFFF